MQLLSNFLKTYSLLFVFCFGFSHNAFAALNVAVEASSSPAAPGELLLVRVTVTNPGTVAAPATRLEIPYPAGLQSMSNESASDGGVCTNSSCEPGETLAWNLGSLGAGLGKSVYFSPAVSSSAANGSTIAFLVRALESTVLRDESTQVLTVNATRLLNIAAYAQQDPVAPASQLTYELVYGNRGNAATTDTTLRFPIPAGTTFVSATDGGAQNGTDVVWTLGLINAGDSGQRRVTVQLGGSAAVGTLLEVDSATISGDAEFVTQSAKVAVVTRVENAPQLDFAITTSNDPARPDEFLHTYLTVTNRTNTVLNGVGIQLFYNSGLNSVDEFAEVSDGGGCINSSCDPGETVFWNLGSLPPGTGKTVTLTPSTLSTNPDGRLIPFVGKAFADTTRERWERRIVTTEAGRFLGLSAHAQQDPAAPLSALTYELVYGNRSAIATTDTTLRFPIPAGTTFVSATDGGVANGNEVVWNLGLIAAGDSGFRRVTVQIDSTAVVGTLLEVDFVSISGEAEFFMQSAKVAVATRIENAPQLDFAITTSNDSSRADEFLQTHLTVTNRTNAVVTGVNLQLFYNSGLNSVDEFSEISDGGGCINSSCDPGETVLWSLGSLAPGTGKTVTLTPTTRADNPNGRLIPLVARAFADSVRDRWERRIITTRSNRLLGLSAHAQQDPVAPSNQLTYELVYGNRGTSATANTTLRFPIPPGTTFVSATDGGTLNGNEVVWNLGLFNAGDSGQRRVTIQLGASATVGTLVQVDAVTLTGDVSFFAQTAKAAVVTRVENSPQLSLAITTSTDNARPDEYLHTYLTVTNRTNAVLTGVSLELFYNGGLNSVDELLEISDAGGCINSTCDPGETVFWNLGSLPPGAGKTVTLTPSTLSSNPNGRIIPFVARAYADSTRERWERRIVSTRANRSLSLTVDASNEPTVLAPNFSVLLTAANGGATAASGTELRMPIPPGVSFISADGGGVLTGNEVVWSVGPLGPGQGTRREVALSVNAPVAGALLEFDAARVLSSNLGQTRATRSVQVKTNAELGLSAMFAPNALLPSSAFSANIAVENRAGAEMAGVTAEMFFPNFINSVNNSAIIGGACSNSSCDTGETVLWNIGNLPASILRNLAITPTITSTTPQGRLVNFFLRARNDAGDRAFLTRSVFVGTLIPAPPFQQVEIDLRGNGNSIVNGDSTPSVADHTDFGSANIGDNQQRAFEIRNLGGLVLNLTGSPVVAISGNTADFTVVTQPQANIAAAATSSLTIRFAPAVAGTRSAIVSIANNDTDENPYIFHLQGSGGQSDLIFQNGFQ